jgi:transposase InsO family protein
LAWTTGEEWPVPWQPKDLMDTKREFVALALQDGANRRELCRRFGITAKTGYALLRRFAEEGQAGLQPRSRRPAHSPGVTPVAMEQAVLQLRQQHPAWGARKIARCLRDRGLSEVPAPSTVTAILRRHGQLSVAASAAATPWQRFEHEQPNSLWQIDFKGHFDTATQRCHTLTLLDDHSRYDLALDACANQQGASVQPRLEQVFRRYGLPVGVNADNGAPWGSSREVEHGLSQFSVWLIRLGIRVSHSRPYHPQTNGKLERFHRSFDAEVLAGRAFRDLAQAQAAFTAWRAVYNHERPHEALGLDTPAQHYRASPRPFPERLPSIEYAEGDEVVEVRCNGELRFRGHRFKVSNALIKLPVALRADRQHDGCFDVYFCHQRFMRVDLNALTASS